MSQEEKYVICPACRAFVLSEQDDWDGDGFATCVCGVSVDLDGAERIEYPYRVVQEPDEPK
jgi:hypothetical protein